MQRSAAEVPNEWCTASVAVLYRPVEVRQGVGFYPGTRGVDGDGAVECSEQRDSSGEEAIRESARLVSVREIRILNPGGTCASV